MKTLRNEFGSPLEAIIYPLLLVALMWMTYWAELVSGVDLVRYGVRPHAWESWKGVLMMPLLHAPNDIAHIVNNSFPALLLFAALVFYYREIAFRVLLVSWLGTGMLVWAFGTNDNSYHIGMSGVIYALFGFLFISGFFRRYRPLQVVSLFVVFLYGSMVWGIFPLKAGVSWEGHFSGLVVGIVLAVIYRKRGPKGPKYQYEIEKELGIEPPDLEGLYNARVEALERQREEMERQQREALHIVYHMHPSKPHPGDDAQPHRQQDSPASAEDKPSDDSEEE